MDPYSGEYHKLKMWIDRFMEIPFNRYTELPVSYEHNSKEECFQFMSNATDILNDAVYGMNDAKLQIMQILGTWISNPNAMGTAIVLKGPAGTGKTTLIKDGISKDKSKFTFRVIHENGVIFYEEEGEDLEIRTKGMKKYYRVVISSSQGTKAWTQPILL